MTSSWGGQILKGKCGIIKSVLLNEMLRLDLPNYLLHSIIITIIIIW